MEFYAAWEYAEQLAFVEANPAEPAEPMTDLDFLLQQAAAMNIYPKRSQAWFALCSLQPF